MNLTLEEASKLRDFMANQCVSYYEPELRDAIRKLVKSLDEFVSDSESFNKQEIEAQEEINREEHESIVEEENNDITDELAN